MKTQEVELELYDKRERSITTVHVEQVAENEFRMVENDVFNCRLTKGTEFETRINKEGKHEVIKITKESEFITRRFFLSLNYKNADYKMLRDEITKRGGFWQVDFGGIATLNIPKDFEFDIDQVMNEWGISLTEIID